MTVTATVAPSTPASQTAMRLLARNGLLIALIVLFAVFALTSPTFLGPNNVQNLLVQIAVPIVLAVPIGLLLMAGELDLSIGSNVGLSAVIVGLLVTTGGIPLPLALLGGLCTGLLIGALNGLLVAGWGWSSLIVTLGGLAAYRGLAQVISPNSVYGFPQPLVSFGNGSFLGIPYLTLVAIVVAVLGWVVLSLTPIGTHIRAIGVNREAAYLSGVRVRPTIFWLFAVAGVAAGIAAIMLAARVNSAPSQTTGLNLEFNTLTAVLLGGIALGGGRGSIRGLVTGVLFLVVLQNGLNFLNVPPAWSMVANGVALFAAAWLDRFSRRIS